MPWHVEKRDGRWCVIKNDDGDNEGCHDSRAKANAQMRALYASERDQQGANVRQREYASFGTELAQATVSGRTLEGYGSVTDYPIDTSLYGTKQTTYVRKGAFKKTIAERFDQIQLLYNHGQDPAFGFLPIGRINELKEDDHGLYVKGELHDAPAVQNVKAALASGALRAMSIQFETTQESYNDDRSERYIEQLKLYEVGPVTFPANEAAFATLHSAPFPLGAELMWDGDAAMRTCSTAAEFRKIAFERANDSDPDTAAHWTLPHHPNPDGAPGNADARGVAAALAALGGARGGRPDLKQSVESVRGHLQGHQAESSSVGDRGEGTRILDGDRLTWAIRSQQALERYARELAEQERRLKAL